MGIGLGEMFLDRQKDMMQDGIATYHGDSGF